METIQLFCKNSGKFYEVEPGCSLKEFLAIAGKDIPLNDWLAAYANNQLKELRYKLYTNQSIEFIGSDIPDGQKVYSRSLCMLVQKAVNELWGNEAKLIFDYSLPMGLYGKIEGRSFTASMKEQLKEKIASYIKADIPFIKKKLPSKDVIALYEKRGQHNKAEICRQIDDFYSTTYWCGDYCDTFYGPLLYSSSCIKAWNIVEYNEGFCLQFPLSGSNGELPHFAYQQKLFNIFEENSQWLRVLGANNISTINNAILKGYAKSVVAVAEVLHERKYAQIADMVYQRRDKVKVVLLAGPSSSGKTTTSLRIAVHLKALGLNPVVIEMDNYFVDRARTPKDEKGEYDFESLYAMDLELLNTQLNQLFNGEEIELPRYDFASGTSRPSGRRIKLKDNDILVMEGIHALNPELTSGIAPEKKFKVYASALTTLSIDENNYISTSDNRLLRRIVRDNNFRSYSAENTILRWKSVRNGEMKNIFPYQENADIMFNSSLIYELCLLKYFAEPQLRKISKTSAAYPEANRLLKFLSFVQALSPEDHTAIPPTSIMREFIGGSSFKY